MVSEKGNNLKLLFFVFTSLFIYSLGNIELLFIIFLFIICFTFLSINKVRKFFRGLLYANIFALFVVGTILLIDYEKNLTLALTILLKTNIILLLGFILILPMGVFNLIKTLEDLKFPSKLILILLLSYRYIELFKSEYKNLKKSAECRGFKSRFTLKTYRTYGYLLGTLTVKTYLKTKEVYKAMILRGL